MNFTRHFPHIDISAPSKKRVSTIKMSNTGGRRLKQWLIEQIQSAQYSGLLWEDESRTMFRIPWKHAGKQDYNQEIDASIFKVCLILPHLKIVLFFVLFFLRLKPELV